MPRARAVLLSPLARWLLTAMLGVVLGLVGLVWRGMASDVQKNSKDIDQLSDVVKKIEINQAENAVQQKLQTDVLGKILVELKKPKEPEQ